MNRLKSELLFLNFLKDAKRKTRRALVASADEFIKYIFQVAVNTLEGKYKFKKDEKSKIKKHRIYENRL